MKAALPVLPAAGPTTSPAVSPVAEAAPAQPGRGEGSFASMMEKERTTAPREAPAQSRAGEPAASTKEPARQHPEPAAQRQPERQSQGRTTSPRPATAQARPGECPRSAARQGQAGETPREAGTQEVPAQDAPSMRAAGAEAVPMGPATQAQENPPSSFALPPWLAMMLPAAPAALPPAASVNSAGGTPAGTGSGGALAGAQDAAQPAAGHLAADVNTPPPGAAPAATGFALPSPQPSPGVPDASREVAQRTADPALVPPPPAGAAPLGAAPAMVAAPLAAEPPPAQHQATLASHPLSAAFAGDIAAEVSILAREGLQTAELRLNPVELGPIRIELSVANQVAEINFAAAHATTREGIEQSLSQLRELLSSQGMSLGHAGVSSDPRGGQAEQRQEGSRPSMAGSPRGGGEDARMSTPVAVRAPRGMLDLYA